MSKIYAVTMPKWGIEMEEGTITAWLIEEGAAVEKGVNLIDIETSKIVNTLESPYSGILVRYLAATDETLNVGALLGIIAQEDVSVEEVDAFVAAFKPIAVVVDNSNSTPESAQQPQAEVPLATRVDTTRVGKTRISPPVRRLANSLGVDVDLLAADGFRVTKQMVEDAATASIAANETAAIDAAALGLKIVPMSQLRKTIAKRLVEAKTTIPHYYLTADYNLDGLLKQRETLNFDAAEKISINDMLISVVAKALQAEPKVNVTLMDNDIHYHSHVNIAIAVATDDGLIAPILAGVEAMDIHQIASGVRDIAKRAVDKTLVAGDLENGTFTISNLGKYGLSSFQAIVNPPQGAILAIGGVESRAVVVNGEIKVASMLTVNLSCDHRIIDGAVGASFLQALRTEIEG